jgi:ParB-like chromosome segregation protein Spo0J
MNTTLRIDDIKIRNRYRKDLGDIALLAASITQVGLLHRPVVTEVDGEYELVVGERRVEAFKLLGRTEIPVYVAEGFDDVAQRLRAEQDENTCRKDMAVSEAIALGLALEPLEKREARGRMLAGVTPSENFTEGSRKGQSIDHVAAAVGMSRPTYDRAKKVIAAAQDESLPEEDRAIAVSALEEMDRTGKVTPAFNKVAPVIGRIPIDSPQARTKKAPGDPYVIDTKRKGEVAEAEKRRMVDVLSYIDGACRGLKDLKVPMIAATSTSDELNDWASKAQSFSRDFRDLHKKLMAATSND